MREDRVLGAPRAGGVRRLGGSANNQTIPIGELAVLEFIWLRHSDGRR
jgi:hypothetical protein